MTMVLTVGFLKYDRMLSLEIGTGVTIGVYQFPNVRVEKILLPFSSVQSLSHVWLYATPWTVKCQASLSITNFRSLLKLMFIEPIKPSNHLLFCHPFLLPPSIFPSSRVFTNESVLLIRWPKHWSFSFNISPSNEYLGLISFRMD